MRKEGIVIIIIGLALLFMNANSYHFFNAFALFVLVGGIAGTPFSLPEWLMLAFILAVFAAGLVWPFRQSKVIVRVTNFMKSPKLFIRRTRQRRSNQTSG